MSPKQKHKPSKYWNGLWLLAVACVFFLYSIFEAITWPSFFGTSFTGIVLVVLAILVLGSPNEDEIDREKEELRKEELKKEGGVKNE